MAVIWMNTMKNMLVHYFIQNLCHWTWNMVLRLVPIIAYFILWSETENPLTKISSKLPSFWPGGSTSNIRLAGWDENHDKDVKQCLRFKLNFSWFLFVRLFLAVLSRRPPWVEASCRFPAKNGRFKIEGRDFYFTAPLAFIIILGTNEV